MKVACSLCSAALSAAKGVACDVCRAPHHPDCFDYMGVCSVYGCGGLETIPLSQVRYEDDALVLSESTVARLPVPRPSLPTALKRRLGAHAHALPRTVGMGTLGIAGGLLLLTGAGWLKASLVGYGAFVGAGALFGVLSAYLGPIQHRYPGYVAVASACAVGGLFFLLKVLAMPLLLTEMTTAATMVATMVMATSLADRYLGPRSHFGPKLGRANGVARLLATWIGCMLPAIIFAWILAPGLLHAPAFLQFLGVSAGVLTAASWPALEQGKAAYLARLPPGRRGVTAAGAAAE